VPFCIVVSDDLGTVVLEPDLVATELPDMSTREEIVRATGS
jgi:hypothetical protein